MAFDYGTKRIGIAVTDPLQIIATALMTVHPKDIFEFIKKYLEEEPVERFVVGMPLRLDGTDSESAQHVVGFVRLLKKHFPSIDVVTIDERYTSKMASATIAQSDLRKSKRQDKSLIDQISAVIILQSYMASQ
ncbi:MAG TPA: Holliday junction resolvase RuvX [Sphingobacteriaceae bacterium]|nr:Holliday junction resolvase RuvX [Sphingobacteriaceae bacterium]